MHEDLKLSYEWIENVLHIYLPECQSFKKLKVKKGKKNKVKVEVECRVDEGNDWKKLKEKFEAPKGFDIISMEEMEWKVGDGILTVTLTTDKHDGHTKDGGSPPRVPRENDDSQVLVVNVVAAALVIVALGAYYIFRN
ncbi:unnamed protein product [Cuscuta campestris]|uniref:SHSP domain-containing protein n=1 Tax=Cuscuta campestris TaxID=132261 RepID=A0A484KP91_9ASTE|nr:unnamed protein product [Cuscuta campestris]